jgi:sugar/nucleoside kinase (ribokinase family)
LATREEFERIRQMLLDGKMSGMRCLVGFDGFVDSMYRPVRQRQDVGAALYYDTIASFGDRIVQSAGKSSDTEIVLTQTRAGGNGPLLSLALAAAGVPVTCIGMLGEPGILPEFSTLKDACRCFSLGNPFHTLAFEFQDGKLMFGCQNGQNALTWEGIRSIVGDVGMDDMLQESALIALVDWSYLWNMSEILDGILASIADANVFNQCGKILFFDLTDLSGRSTADIRKMLHVIGKASRRFKTVVGLNESEALTLVRTAGLSGEAGLSEMAMTLRRETGVGMMAIHSLRESAAADISGTESCANIFIENPMLSTGGGDNFNGGLCLGLLSGMPLRESLILGSAAASQYVSTGERAGTEKLLQFLQAHLED